MGARLIYKGNDLNCAFEISAARTVIGRRPWEIEHIAKVEGKGATEGCFELSHRGTTFVIISKDVFLAKSHFEIIRLKEENRYGYFIRDLESHCGIFINGLRPASSNEWVRLENGDKIQSSSSASFEFSVSD